MADEHAKGNGTPKPVMMHPRDFMTRISAETSAFIDSKVGAAEKNDHGTNELIAAALVLPLAERIAYMPDATRGKVLEQLQDQLISALVHIRKTRGLKGSGLVTP